MKGVNSKVRSLLREKRVHPGPHFVCGLVREGQSEDLTGRYPARLDEPGHARHDGSSLAGAGSGKNEDRTVRCGYGCVLF